MPPAHVRFRLRWHTVVIAALTIGLLWWFFRSLDLVNVWNAIKHAHPGLIALTVGVTIGTYVVRAWRWQALLRPIGHAPFRTAFRTTIIGFAATFLLPGRIGEVLRPYLLARKEGFSTPATFATIIIERLLDLATVVLLFGGFLLVTTIDVGPNVRTGGALAAVGALLALGAMSISAGHPERLARWTEKGASMLPGRAAEIAGRFVHTFVQGLAVMRSPGVLLIAAALSVVMWVLIAVGVWLASMALDVTFPFSGSFLVLMYLVVGVALPTPAGVGGFHAMYKWAVTTHFQATDDLAAAAAIVLHAASFLPISLLGLIFMAQDGLSLGGLSKMKDTATKETDQG